MGEFPAFRYNVETLFKEPFYFSRIIPLGYTLRCGIAMFKAMNMPLALERAGIRFLQGACGQLVPRQRASWGSGRAPLGSQGQSAFAAAGEGRGLEERQGAPAESRETEAAPLFPLLVGLRSRSSPGKH